MLVKVSGPLLEPGAIFVGPIVVKDCIENGVSDVSTKVPFEASGDMQDSEIIPLGIERAFQVIECIANWRWPNDFRCTACFGCLINLRPVNMWRLLGYTPV